MPRSSLQTRLMVTTIGTLVLGIGVVLVLLWLVAGSEDGLIQVTVSNLQNTTPIDDTLNATQGVVATSSSDSVWRFMLFGLTVLVVVLAVSVVGAWLLNRSLFGRIHQISNVAHALDERQLDARFETTAHNDEVDQMATAINAALDRLQSGFERQRMFVRAASHELRTPLTIARTAIEMPLVEGRVPAELSGDVADVLAAQTQLEHLLDTLLLLSRGEIDPPQLLSVDDVIRNLIDQEQQHPGAETIAWQLNLEPVIATISPRAFEITVANVLSNAVNHNREHGWCEVVLRRTGSLTTITVENSGAVIEPELVDRLSQPFVKGESSLGSGLGLAVVDQMMTALGGRAHITPREAGGLTVVLEIPDAMPD